MFFYLALLDIMFVDSKAIERKNKANTLSKILRIDQPVQSNKSLSLSPDIKLIKTLKEKLDTYNPFFRLSMENYEQMCKNKILFNMMVTVLKTDKKKLKKICKYINILKENINSSPESIKNKMKIQKINIIDLPDNILNDIVKIYENTLEYELHDWIPIDKLHWDKLSLNPNAINILEKKIKEEMILFENREYNVLPNNKKINWANLSENPNIYELIKKFKIFGKDSKSSDSKSDKSEYILKVRDELRWKEISKHANAIDLILENKDKINWTGLSENTSPKAIEFLKKKWEEEKHLMINNITEYNKMKSECKIISWPSLSKNINAIDLLREKIEQEKILLNNGPYNRLGINEKISWKELSENSEAIELLEENENRIDWYYLSSNTNPKVINLLKERIKYEKGLSYSEYKNLNSNHIAWGRLSENPIAIELLKANPSRISWIYLSQNPEAINIINLPENYNKIYWLTLSKNINAINLLEQKFKEEKNGCIKDCIDWKNLSENPSIFTLK